MGERCKKTIICLGLAVRFIGWSFPEWFMVSFLIGCSIEICATYFSVYVRVVALPLRAEEETVTIESYYNAANSSFPELHVLLFRRCCSRGVARQLHHQPVLVLRAVNS